MPRPGTKVSRTDLRPVSTGSALALLVPRVAANHVHHTAAADDLTAFANPLDAGTDFHDFSTGFLSGTSKASQYTHRPPNHTRPSGKEIRRFGPISASPHLQGVHKQPFHMVQRRLESPRRHRRHGEKQEQGEEGRVNSGVGLCDRTFLTIGFLACILRVLRASVVI